MNEVEVIVSEKRSGDASNRQEDSRNSTDDFRSIGSSVEIRDAAINESWDWAIVQRRLQQRENAIGIGRVVNKPSQKRHRDLHHHQVDIRLDIGDSSLEHLTLTRNKEQQQESWLGGIWRWWNERVINVRLADYDDEERQAYISNRVSRVITIFSDENTKEQLSSAMLCSNTQVLLRREDSLALMLSRKYGQKMTEWVTFYANQTSLQNTKGKKKSERKKLAAKTLAQLKELLAVDIDEYLLANAASDPLMGWFRQRSDVSSRMLARIQNVASSISQNVSWSFLIEPGKPSTDLSKFYAEFDVLENFFDKIELSPEECSQKAFDANCLLKVRNRKLTCLDWSRVRLAHPNELIPNGNAHGEYGATTRRLQPADIFGDFDCPQIATGTEFGQGDFINASYVRGGPLLNTFILTQAPLQQTIPDFWHMVWQEQSEWIFMLCEPTIDPSVGDFVVGSVARSHCPFYWPRFDGEMARFGRLCVKNLGIDASADPLFLITHLELWTEENEQQQSRKLRIQLWQWDWRNFDDFQWPFRVLLRARNSKRPTILMCADGCGRSGTLVLIETFLMQLLRGAVSLEHPMLTAAVFIRLQRRHAIASSMQYLFAYRTVLHWLQPFVISWYHRLTLGFTLKGSGFCAKYAEIAYSYAHKKNLLV